MVQAVQNVAEKRKGAMLEGDQVVKNGRRTNRVAYLYVIYECVSKTDVA